MSQRRASEGREMRADAVERRRYKRVGKLVYSRVDDYEEAWYAGEFESKAGTTRQSMDDVYKYVMPHEWVDRPSGKHLYRKGTGYRRIWNARGLRPANKDVSRETIRREYELSGAELADLFAGTPDYTDDEYLSRDSVRLGVCKGCGDVLYLSEARLHDMDVCWSCAREIDAEMMVRVAKAENVTFGKESELARMMAYFDVKENRSLLSKEEREIAFGRFVDEWGF